MSSLRISTDIVSQITLASRAALEIPLDSDEDVHETIGLKVDLNLLFRDFPMQVTGGRIMPLSIPQIAKDNLNKAFLSTAETPGSTVPHGSMSGWRTHRLEGDQLDPEKVFLPSNFSQATFEEVFSDQILEMSAALDSANVRVKQGVVAEWLDTVDKPIQGNVDQDEAYYKNFLHAFVNSTQLEDLLRSSVAMSLSDAPQPNKMEGGGADPSDESIALTQDSLENRTDFKNGKVFPTQTNNALQRWTSFLKLRQGDSWMFKLQLSIHDSEFKTSESRLYRFILQQQDSAPEAITLSDAEGVKTFTIEKPLEIPNSLGTDYTGSLAYMGLDISTEESQEEERCVNTNSMFHTGKALALEHINNPSLRQEHLEDGFLCALLPDNPIFAHLLTDPIFATAQACIKEKGQVGVITQLHPIKDSVAQLEKYLETDKCLVIPAVDWMDMKNETDDTRRVQKIFQSGESKTYPTCHVKVHAGSGVQFRLHFAEDGTAGSDPNADTTLAPAARLTDVELVQDGVGYTPTDPNLPHQAYYRWTLAGTNGEYDHAASGSGTESFWDFMIYAFEVVGENGGFAPRNQDGDFKVPYTDQFEPILSHDPHEMRVVLEPSALACRMVSMSDSMRVPLFHNQDVQGTGSTSAINNSSCSIYSHPFQNHQGTGGDLVVNQPIQQNQAQDVQVQWPPQESIDDGSTAEQQMQVAKILSEAGLQYSKAKPYLETGGFGERGNYHDVGGANVEDLAKPEAGDGSLPDEYATRMGHVSIDDMTIHQRYRHESALQLVHGIEEQWFLEHDGTVDWNLYGSLDNVNWADYADDTQQILAGDGTTAIAASEINLGSTFTTFNGVTEVTATGTATLREYKEIQVVDVSVNAGLLMDALDPTGPYRLTNSSTTETVLYTITTAGNVSKILIEATDGGQPAVEFLVDSQAGTGEVELQLDPERSIVFHVLEGDEALTAKIQIVYGAEVQIADIGEEKRYQVVTVGGSAGATAGMSFTASSSAPALENQDYANYNGTAYVERTVVYPMDHVQVAADTATVLNLYSSTDSVNTDPLAQFRLAPVNSEKDVTYRVTGITENSLTVAQNGITKLALDGHVTVPKGEIYYVRGDLIGLPESAPPITVTEVDVLNSEIFHDSTDAALAHFKFTYTITDLQPQALELGSSIGATAENPLVPVTAGNIKSYPSSKLDDHSVWPKYRKIVTKQKAFDVVKKSYAVDSEDQPILDSASVLRISIGTPEGESKDIQIQIRFQDNNLENLSIPFTEQPAPPGPDPTDFFHVDVDFGVQEGETLDDGDAEFKVGTQPIYEYLASQIATLSGGLVTVTPGSTEWGGITVLQLSDGYRFLQSPIGIDAGAEQDSLPFRIEGDCSPADELYLPLNDGPAAALITRMECWPFASQGVRFVLKKGRQALAEYPDESQLPRLSLHDQGSLIRVELAELDPTGGGSVVVPMNMGLSGSFSVDLTKLRDIIFGCIDENSSDMSCMFRDYVLRIHLTQPTTGGGVPLEHSSSEVQVDTAAKQFTLVVNSQTNNQKLLAGDNSELTTQDVIATLSAASFTTINVTGNDTLSKTFAEVELLTYTPSDVSQDTILSDTNFLEAPEGNLFAYSGGVDLEYRWFDDVPFARLTAAADWFEYHTVPPAYHNRHLKLAQGVGGFKRSVLVMRESLQGHFAHAGEVAFRFYGEVGVFPNVTDPDPDIGFPGRLKDLEDIRTDLDWEGEGGVKHAIRMYLADRNFTLASKVAPVELGRFVSVNHSGALLPFAEAEDGLHKDNFPRDYIVRACHVYKSGGDLPSLVEDLKIEYDRAHLTAQGQDAPSKQKCYPLVCNGDQARVAQIKMVAPSA